MLNETFEQRTAIFVAVRDDMETAIKGTAKGSSLTRPWASASAAAQDRTSRPTQACRHGLKQRLRAV